MPNFNSFILGKVKDKASIGKVRLLHSFSSKSVRYIHLALLKSTTHTSNKPPNSGYVSDVVSYSNSRYAPAAFAAVLWRLRVTKNAYVATKSLIVLHKLIKMSKDKFEVQQHHHGWNNLKLNDFSDKSSNLALELSQWVRWYGLYLDRMAWLSKILGSYPSMDLSSKEKDRVMAYQTEYITRQTDSIVSFFEHICTRPETPPMFQNKIVDEIRELVIQDYFALVRSLMVRLQVLRERFTEPGFEHVDDSGLNDIGLVLMRLGECKGSLSGFFWRYRRLAEDFWCLVEIFKADVVKNDMEMVESAGSVQKLVKDDEKKMVEFSGSVQKMVKDDEKQMVEFSGSVQIWVTFDDSKIATVESDSKWVTFEDDLKGLTNEPTRLSLCT